MKRRTTKKIKKRNLFHGRGGTPSNTRNTIHPKVPFQMIILPCNYYNKDCDNDENVAITISKELYEHLKIRKLNDQNMMSTILSKNHLFIAEPETIPSSGYDPIKKWLDPHYYIEDDPKKIIVDEPVEYYMIKESKPYLQKLGKCVKKTKEAITFKKTVNDIDVNTQLIDIEIEVTIRDIVEHKVLIITESGIKLFAYMNNLGKLSKTAINYIRNERKRLNQTQKAVIEKDLAKKGTELLRKKLALYDEENKKIQDSSKLINTDNASTNSNSKDITEENNTTRESSILSDSELKDLASVTLSDVKSLSPSLPNTDLLASRSLPVPINNNNNTKLVRSSSSYL
jgi:hypothetical protein